MDFFGMGMGEVVTIVILAVLIFGPEKVVEVSRTIGKALRSIRSTTSTITSQITREIDEQKKETSTLTSDLKSMASDITSRIDKEINSPQGGVKAVVSGLKQEINSQKEIIATSLNQVTQETKPEENLTPSSQPVEKKDTGTRGAGE